MTVTVEPATIIDLAALSGAMTRRQWRVAKFMRQIGEIYALRAAAPLRSVPSSANAASGPTATRLIALGYLCPILGTPDVEAGFNFSPVDDEERGLGRADRHMLGIFRAIRLTLDASPYASIVTETRTGAGERLARAAGFTPTGRQGTIGEIWSYGGHAHGRSGQAAARGASPAN
jgi:hypothetical protein